MESAERWQSIAPASDEPGKQRPITETRRRRQAVAVACVQCRSGKAKCDGVRPRCTRCNENDLPCRYDVAEGVSRSQRMKMLKKDSLSAKLEELERVINALRSESDTNATGLLARLRLGERVEDLAHTLPSTTFFMDLSLPPSLLSQESTGTSGSSPTADSMATPSDNAVSPYKSGSTDPSSFAGQSQIWPSSISAASSLQPVSMKETRSLATSPLASKPSILHILFDRGDFQRGGEEKSNDCELDIENFTTLDPRLLTQDLSFTSTNDSTQHAAEQLALPEVSANLSRAERERSITSTIRVHSNFDVRTQVGSLPNTSDVWTNEHAFDTHAARDRDILIPLWAIMPVNTTQDLQSITEAFQGVIRDAAVMLRNGILANTIVEKHPNIAALFDEEEYQRSGILSKWAASMVHSLLLKGNDFTAYALMYVFWYLMRWVLVPSSETYSVIPEWLRPTPKQLFLPHTIILDFVIWPSFRDFAVQSPFMQERMEWMMDMSAYLQCDWSFPGDEALKRDDETGFLDLCDMAKMSLRDLSNWSVGPSFRAYVNDADSYLRVRNGSFTL